MKGILAPIPQYQAMPSDDDAFPAANHGPPDAAERATRPRAARDSAPAARGSVNSPRYASSML